MAFKKGCIPWNKGKQYTQKGQFKKGNHPKTEFKKGHKGYFKGKKFTKEHKVKIADAQKGELSHRWKGGEIKKEGYVLIHKPDHPFCWTTGYVRRSHLVVEKEIGRYLKPDEVVHHLGNKDDDRSHKLMAFINDDVHKKFHKNARTAKPSEIIYDGRK